MHTEHLEPAERDPKALRRTAFILVSIMLLGGVIILLGYQKWSKKKEKDDRPAIVYRITKERDLRVIRQDGKLGNLYDLRGSVIAINTISKDQPERAKLSAEIMQHLAEKYAGNTDFHLVTLVIEPIAPEQAIPTLQQLADQLGTRMPQWWLGTNESETLTKFIKNELKTNIFPSFDGTAWDFDTSITLIDKNGHIRRATVPQKRGGPPYISTFDFDQAAGWDARGVKTGTDLSNVQQLEALLTRTIDTLLNEPRKDG